MSVYCSGPAWDADLEPTEKLVLLAFSDQAEADGWMRARSLKFVHDMTRLGERTIRRHVGALAKLGHLEIHEQPGKASAYRVWPNITGTWREGDEGDKRKKDPGQVGRGAKSAGVPPRQGTPATMAGSGATMAGDPGQDGTPYKNPISSRSSPDLSRESRANSAVDNSGNTKGVYHPSHKSAESPEWMKQPVDRAGLHTGIKALMATLGATPSSELEHDDETQGS